MIRFIIITVAVLACSATLSARTIAEQLDERKNVKITLPEALRARLAPPAVEAEAESDEAAPAVTEQPAATTSAGGYRIQVFSDNNPRTAKREAESKAGAIATTFPQWATYISFDSPYWRLRVGDFRTYEDATHAVVELKNAFPAWRRELRVVRDRIKVAVD